METSRHTTPASAPPSAPGPQHTAAWGRPDAFEPIAPGLARLEIGFVNAYAIGLPGGPWVLVDTGLPRTEGLVKRAAERYFGRGANAILLTHGHFDHAGNAKGLAVEWDAPIYAHRAEMPFVAGWADYPPQDPTMGGAIAFLARTFPHAGYDLRPHVHELPADHSVPELEGWRWLHTPGHTPGHVSFFREDDRLLLAGDALATMDLDAWGAQLTHAQRLSRPPAPFTPDWAAARASLAQLVDLEPARIGAGHGPPFVGPETAAHLRHFAAHRFRPPRRGRYVGDPIEANAEDGVTYLPPPVSDPLMPKLALGVGALGFALGLALARRVHRVDTARP